VRINAACAPIFHPAVPTFTQNVKVGLPAQVN